VGWGFFMWVGEKNKINSLKFAQTYQRAKYILILNLSISYLSVDCLFTLVANVLAVLKVADLRTTSVSGYQKHPIKVQKFCLPTSPGNF
jgi:hypothetical protein